MNIVDKLNGLFRPRPKPTPQPVPEPAAPSVGKYLQIWRLLQQIPVTKLFPAVVSVSGVVFLAISGLIAWLVVFAAFVIRLFKIAL